MKFRVATANDSDWIGQAVGRLIVELGGPETDASEFREAARNLIDQPEKGLAVVAVEGKKPIGVCTLSFQFAIRTSGDHAVIQEMYIEPAFRGRGVGRLLLNATVNLASKNGCNIVELGTPPNGERQEHFYRAAGFKAVGTRMRYIV